MPSSGFEPAMPATERPQTHALDRAATEIEHNNNNNNIKYITKLVEYVHRKEDQLIQTVRTHQHNMRSAVLRAARRLKTESQSGTRQIKDSVTEKTKERWRKKRMRGQLTLNLEGKLVDNE